jgi:hypothetical protein
MIGKTFNFKKENNMGIKTLLVALLLCLAYMIWVIPDFFNWLSKM